MPEPETMTNEDALKYAREIADGGKVRADEVRAFMRALLVGAGATAAKAEPSASSTAIEPLDALPAVPEYRAPVRHAQNSIHLPAGCNGFYTLTDARALAAALVQTAEQPWPS